MKKVLFLLTMLLVTSVSYVDAKKKEPKLPETYNFKRGMEAYQEENYEEALQWFDKELEENPENAYAYLSISAIKSLNNEYGPALTAINKTLKFMPKKANEGRALALCMRADLYLNLEDTVRAFEDYEQSLKLNPSNGSIYKKRGQIFYEKADYDRSDEEYRKLIDLDEGDAFGYVGLGRNANMQQNWDEAIKQFNQAIKLSPSFSQAICFRAQSYYGKKMWNEAADDIITALNMDRNPYVYEVMDNFPEEGFPILKSKMKIQMTKEPSNPLWFYCAGYLDENKENYDSAISNYNKAYELEPDSFFLEKIADCYHEKGEYGKALSYVEEYLAADPEEDRVLNLKADLLGELGQFEESVKERDWLVNRYPEYSLSYLNRAEDLMSLRRFEEAIEDYTTATVLQPSLKDFPYLLLKRGDAYRLTDNITEANADYNHLLEVEKDSVLNSSSWTPFAYSGLGNLEKALETMQTILKNDTTDIKGNLYNLACLYARSGEKQQALNYLKKAIEKGYKRSVHIASDYDLYSLHDLPEFKSLVDSLSNAHPQSIQTKVIEEEIVVPEVVAVPFTKEGGVTKVKCSINELPLHFVFDTGASDVTLSMVEANFMMKNGYIKPGDIIGSARYIDANGDISEGTVINLKKVNFGGLELDNVRASVVRNQKAPLLLGQSVLGRLGKIEIDNTGKKIVITHKNQK